MLSFFKRKPSSALHAFAGIGADMHNHVLPGIDDGSPDCDTSMVLLEGLFDLGFSRVIATPHILPEIHPNTSATIGLSYEKLIEYEGAEPYRNKLTYAAEYMIDEAIEEKIRTGSLLTFGKDMFVLIEMSFAAESPNLREVLFQLISRGYQPVLAHPERYSYYHGNLPVFETLMDAGCTLQVNLLSLAGYYGPREKAMAEKLISKGWVEWLGTDMHHGRHLQALRSFARQKNSTRLLAGIKRLRNRDLL